MDGIFQKNHEIILNFYYHFLEFVKILPFKGPLDKGEYNSFYLLSSPINLQEVML